MERITFGRWTLLVDRDATRKAYEGCDGWTQECDCDACRNFIMARERAFGPQVLELFDKLGIDIKCDSEAYLVGPSENKWYQYAGWFHFVGEIESEADGSAFQNIDRGVIDFDRTKEGPAFDIWFSNGHAIPRGDFAGMPVVQLEWTVWVPWVIRAPELTSVPFGQPGELEAMGYRIETMATKPRRFRDGWWQFWKSS